jgi:hypothetical protein
VHVGEHRTGAAEPRLDLIEDQQHAALIAEPAYRSQEADRRHDDAGLTLDRLDQHRAGVFADGTGQPIDVTEVEVTEPRCERSEVGAIGGLRREADHGRRAPMEVAARDDDLGAISGDALGAIAPAPSRLDCGLDRFAATAGGQRTRRRGEVGRLHECLQERTERRRVIGA